MPTIPSKFTKNQLPSATPVGAGSPVVNDYHIDLTAAQLVAGNIIDIGVLPAYCTVTDAMLICGDLDTGAGITLDVGLMSGVPGDAVGVRTSDAVIFAASNVAQAGGIARPTLASALTILSTDMDRSIGVKILAAPAGAVAGRIRLRVIMHPSDQTVQF